MDNGTKMNGLYHVQCHLHASNVLFLFSIFLESYMAIAFNKRSIFTPNIFGIIYGSTLPYKLKFLILDAFGADKRLDDYI